MKAVIVGAGIGGLGAAIALARNGAEAEIVEQAHALAEVGAGLSLAPNALAALDRLGVGDAIRAAGATADRILIRSKNGTLLSAIDVRGREWEVVGVHRADLQSVLLAAVGANRIRLGRRCVGFDDDGDGVRVFLDDGSSLTGDVLVGADGIRSIIRRRLNHDDALRYAGYVGWRAVIPFEHSDLTRTFSESWGPVFRVGLITIGRGRLYWFASELAAEDAAAPADAKRYLGAELRGWHDPIPAVLDATPAEALSRLPIYDREPLRRWGEGNVTLLGDAAHPMTPNLGQGAAQALEDAVALGTAVGKHATAAEALREYEGRRIERTTMIVKRSWQLGRIAHLRGSLACRLRDQAMRLTPVGVQRRQQEAVIRPGF